MGRVVMRTYDHPKRASQAESPRERDPLLVKRSKQASAPPLSSVTETVNMHKSR